MSMQTPSIRQASVAREVDAGVRGDAHAPKASTSLGPLPCYSAWPLRGLCGAGASGRNQLNCRKVGCVAGGISGEQPHPCDYPNQRLHILPARSCT